MFVIIYLMLFVLGYVAQLQDNFVYLLLLAILVYLSSYKISKSTCIIFNFVKRMFNSKLYIVFIMNRYKKDKEYKNYVYKYRKNGVS